MGIVVEAMMAGELLVADMKGFVDLKEELSNGSGDLGLGGVDGWKLEDRCDGICKVVIVLSLLDKKSGWLLGFFPPILFLLF